MHWSSLAERQFFTLHVWSLAERKSEMSKTVTIAGVECGNDRPFVLMGGVNVLESKDLAFEIAGFLTFLRRLSTRRTARQLIAIEARASRKASKSSRLLKALSMYL